MPGLSPKLPLSIDAEDGYTLNKDYRSMVSQNLKMLILTSPGERVMIPEFGVGIRRYFFQNKNSATYDRIRADILEQASKYMPFLDILEINISDLDSDPAVRDNGIYLKIKYFITPLNITDVVELEAAA
jgi:uncharacterized protein